MDKTEILNIVNNPSKHIQITKIDGKDEIVYSSEFVKLLESIPTMFTKDDIVAKFKELQEEVDELYINNPMSEDEEDMNKGIEKAVDAIQQKIEQLKGEQ